MSYRGIFSTFWCDQNIALKFNNFNKFITWILFIFSRLIHYLRSNDVVLAIWALVNKDHFNKGVWILPTSQSNIHGCHLVGRNLWSKIIGCVLIFMIFPTLILWAEQLLPLASASDSSRWPVLFVSFINLPKLCGAVCNFTPATFGDKKFCECAGVGWARLPSCAHMVALWLTQHGQSEMLPKPRPIMSSLWRTEWTVLEQGKEACQGRMPEVLNLGIKHCFKDNSFFLCHLVRFQSSPFWWL